MENTANDADNGATSDANNGVDFDALCQKTMTGDVERGDLTSLNNLYSAVFSLEKWHFIARGEFPNVNPYIASNANYAGGQHMIRAFTDTERLTRFVKENHLENADGTHTLLSIPTEGIIDYLEKFMADGVHGVWFNSDTASDGFFVPLQQLRPIKVHLERLNLLKHAAQPVQLPAESPAEPSTQLPNTIQTLIIALKDGLLLPSGFVAPSPYTCTLFCRVPSDWLEDRNLKAPYLEKIYEKMYGPTWRQGNSDGSSYVVRESRSDVVAPEMVNATNWSGAENTGENHYWFYLVPESGEVKNVTAEEFQADVDASV